jgi:hypothetical protein
MPGTGGCATCAALAVTSRLSGKSSTRRGSNPRREVPGLDDRVVQSGFRAGPGLLHARPLAGLAKGTRGVIAAWMLSCLSSADIDLGSCFGLAWPG